MKRKLNADDVHEAVSNGHGKDSQPTKSTFASLGLDSRLLQAANQQKFSTPTPVQTKAVPLALGGKDVLGMCSYSRAKYNS
jgi:superfamily II DNA/RNA helicase